MRLQEDRVHVRLDEPHNLLLSVSLRQRGGMCVILGLRYRIQQYRRVDFSYPSLCPQSGINEFKGGLASYNRAYARCRT